jgi:hypothetical protein
MELSPQIQERLSLLVCALVLVLTACASNHPREQSLLKSPGELRAAASLGAQAVWEQRVTAYWGEGESYAFNAVIQRVDESLTVLGLSPTGSVGFSIVLANGEVELVNNMPDDFPFPPRNVLLDVQRAFYPWLAVGATDGVIEGERVQEIWSEGKLSQRTFARTNGVPEGLITITYKWGSEQQHIPSSTVLDNGWFDYRLEIETKRETLLAGSNQD